MSGVPNVFGSATSSIPLSQLDVNFNTPVTIGNTTVGLGNTVTSFGNVTLTNTTISGLSGGSANGVVYINSSNVAVASPAVLAFDGTNLGLGVTPVTPVYSASRNLFIGQATNLIGRSTINFTSLNTNVYEAPSSSTPIYINSSTAVQYVQYLGQHIWNIAPSGTAGNAITFTQAMTLDASGNLLVGTTSQYGSGKVSIPYSSLAFGISMQSTTTSATNYAIEFKNTSGSGVGAIVASTTATTYQTSSDYRLKHDIAPMTGALAKVAALKPVTYKWNADNSDGEGFIAHELAEVVPQCVTGEKDAVDADGKPQYQGIDTSFLVATLTSAIQELSTLITAQQSTIQSLTERITALEGART